MCEKEVQYSGKILLKLNVGSTFRIAAATECHHVPVADVVQYIRQLSTTIHCLLMSQIRAIPNSGGVTRR